MNLLDKSLRIFVAHGTRGIKHVNQTKFLVIDAPLVLELGELHHYFYWNPVLELRSAGASASHRPYFSNNFQFEGHLRYFATNQSVAWEDFVARKSHQPETTGQQSKMMSIVPVFV